MAAKCRQSILQLTKAKFVRGPSASMDTSPGYSETLSTKNSEALFSIFFAFGGGRNAFPNPSEPWIKSATRGLPPFARMKHD